MRARLLTFTNVCVERVAVVTNAVFPRGLASWSSPKWERSLNCSQNWLLPTSISNLYFARQQWSIINSCNLLLVNIESCSKLSVRKVGRSSFPYIFRHRQATTDTIIFEISWVSGKQTPSPKTLLPPKLCKLTFQTFFEFWQLWVSNLSQSCYMS